MSSHSTLRAPRPWAAFAFAFAFSHTACAPAERPPARPLVISPQQAPDRDAPERPARASRPCTIREASLNDVVRFRTRPKGTVLAELVDAAAHLELTESSPRLELSKGGVVLWTPYDRAEHPLRFQRPVALAEVLTLAPGASVEWVEQRGGLELVRYTATEALHGAALEAEVACDALGLNLADFPMDWDPDGEPCTLEDATPVSASAGTPPVLTLPPGDEPITCVELERSGDFVRIAAADMNEAMLTGWVPSRFVSEGEDYGGFGLRGIGGGGRAYGRVPLNVDFVACPDDLRLFVEAGEAPVEVGVVRRGTPFQVLKDQASDPRFSRVDLWQTWIWPTSGQSLPHFQVDTSRLHECRPVAEE
ncbi:MAG: hypothetical protein R3B89_34185 [Polyangiaceae bacterium]